MTVSSNPGTKLNMESLLCHDRIVEQCKTRNVKHNQNLTLTFAKA